MNREEAVNIVLGFGGATSVLALISQADILLAYVNDEGDAPVEETDEQRADRVWADHRPYGRKVAAIKELREEFKAAGYSVGLGDKASLINCKNLIDAAAVRDPSPLAW